MWRRLIKNLGMCVVAIAMSAPAFSQVSTPASASTPGMELVRYRVMQVYEELIEKRSRETLGRYLPADQFSINVLVEVKANIPMDLPYMPGGGAIYPENINSPVYRDLIQKVAVEVLFAKSVDNASRQQLLQILKNTMKLNDSRGDTIASGDFVLNFAKPNEEFERRIEDIERKLRLTEDDLRRSQRDSDILAREKADLSNKLELAQKQQQNQEQKDDKKPIEEKKEAAVDPAKSVETPIVREPDLQFWISKGLIAGLGLFSLIILFLVSRTLATAIAAIAKGIGSLGTSLQGMGSGATAKGSETKVEINQTGGSNQAGAVSGAAPSLDIEMARRRLEELQKELLDKLNDNTTSIVLQYLNRTLRQDSSVARGVAAMELLGVDMANRLYQKLGEEARLAVQKFMRGSGYGNNKYDIMLEAGENLKTNLMGEGLGYGQFVKNPKIVELLTCMTDEEIDDLASKLDEEGLARFMLYFDPGRTALLMSAACNRNPELVPKVADIMLKLPEAEQHSDWDERIIDQLGQWANSQKANAYGPYLKLYKDIVANLGEDLTENVLSKIDQANQMVSSYLRSQIVTYNLLFSLSKELLEEVINGLGNKDLAALLIGSQGGEKKQLIDSISDRRREMVMEEVDALGNLDGRRLKPRVKEARTKVVQVMEQMRKDGKLNLGSDQSNIPGDGGMVAA